MTRTPTKCDNCGKEDTNLNKWSSNKKPFWFCDACNMKIIFHGLTPKVWEEENHS